MTELAERILAVLPQTQCTRCGYPDCAAYAQAVAAGDAAINQCPPGGAEGVVRLAALTGQVVLPLDPAHGPELPRSVVHIDENWCIGCTLCIAACPVDAIMGSNKRMHTVLEEHCTGCELCLPVCPVDCIVVENASGAATGWSAWSQASADKARSRYAFHLENAKQDVSEYAKRPENKTHVKPAGLPRHAPHTDPVVPDQKRAVIEAAMARARAKRAGHSGSTDPLPKNGQ